MTFVKRITGAAALGTGLLIACGLYAPPAQAAFIVTLDQQGGNVVATGSGTLDTAGLTFLTTIEYSSYIEPSSASIFIGPTVLQDAYSGLIGPASFGSGSETPASTDTGDFVGIDGSLGHLHVPAGYSSGNPLSDSATFDDQTLSSLGVTPGTYTWTWGSGPTADSFTLDAVAAPVPEPSGLVLLALPLGLAMLFMRANRRTHAPDDTAA